MTHNNLEEPTVFLFNRTYEDPINEELEDEILDTVDEQIAKFGWKDTFLSWEKYLFDNCTTPESVINFANLFWWFGGQDHPIPIPHHFLGYLYYRIDLDMKKYDTMGILDSLSISILTKAGFSEANLVLNGYYTPENDPLIIEAVNSYRNTKQ